MVSICVSTFLNLTQDKEIAAVLLPRCALHSMQGGLVARKVSVCPSVKRVHCDKTEDKFVQIFIPYEKSFSLVSEKKNGWWRRPLLSEIVGKPAPFGAKLPILNR